MKLIIDHPKEFMRWLSVESRFIATTPQTIPQSNETTISEQRTNI